MLCSTAALHLVSPLILTSYQQDSLNLVPQRELRNTMNDLRGRAFLSDEARVQESVIRHGYASLSYVTWSIIAACTAINALFLFVVAAGPKVRWHPHVSLALRLGAPP